MSKNMAKVRKPACLPENLTMTLDEYSTDTEDEDEVEYQNSTYSSRNKEYEGTPFCCIPRGTGTFIAVDPTITRAPDITFAQQNVHSEVKNSEETFDVAEDYTDLGPWKNFQIPENIEPKKIPPGGHRSYPRMQPPKPYRNISAYQDQQHILDLKEVADHRKKASRYYSTPETSGFRGGTGTEQSSVWGQELSSFEPTNSDMWAGGVRMDSFNVIKYMTPSPKNIKVPPRMIQSYPHQMKSLHKVPPNFSRYSKASPPDTTFRRTEETFSRSPCPATKANVLNATENISKIVHPDYTYSREPVDSSYAARYFTDVCPCRNFNIPSNLQKLNVVPGAHRTFPTAKQHHTLTTFSTHEDKQPIINLKEVAEHRKKAPRFYSTPERDDFLNQGTDQSSVWGQDLSSFKSDETSGPKDSSLGWSQGVRMDSFNVIKYMTPSPKNVKVAPRLIRSYPHLTPSSGRQDPNLTQYSKVVFPDSIRKQTQNYNLPSQNLVADTFCRPQDFTNYPSEPTTNVTCQTPKPKVKFDPRQYSQSQSNRSRYQKQDATFVDPGEKIVPSTLPQVCVPCGALKSFTATQHPQEQRTAPRYYSTPEKEDFLNQGFSESSVWGQDLSSCVSADSNPVEDSSLGWSQGVRMDSFNVIKYMTVSPKDVKVPPKLMQSYPTEARKNIKDLRSTQYSVPSRNAKVQTNLSHPAEPREPINLTCTAKPLGDMNLTYAAEPKQTMNRTFSAEPQNVLNTTYNAEPEGAKNQTYSAKMKKDSNQTYSAGTKKAVNQTYSTEMKKSLNRTYSAGTTDALNQTHSAGLKEAAKVSDLLDCGCPQTQINANVTQNLNDLVTDPCSNQSTTRIHVPRPSRNYLTYVESKEK